MHYTKLKNNFMLLEKNNSNTNLFVRLVQRLAILYFYLLYIKDAFSLFCTKKYDKQIISFIVISSFFNDLLFAKRIII